MSIDKTISEDKKTLTFSSEEDCQRFQDQADKSLEFAAGLLRERYQGRINNLLRTERVTPATINEKVKPLLEGFEFSLSPDGKRVTTELDTVLDVLEALPSGKGGMAGEVPGGKSKKNPLAGMAFGTEEPMPFDYTSGGEMTPERAEEVVKAQFAACGRAV